MAPESPHSLKITRDPLPIDAKREEIAARLRDSSVVIVCGETGSGKTTQLPQIALAIGRGEQGAVAHTQPRRLAARAVAARIASETGTELGTLVGYQIRFDARVSPRTRLRLMTDGILLAELTDDAWLRRYDTVIVDEAHERSLNIDLLLGALRRIVARRPEFRVVITSATIDPQRFSRHFDGAPIIEVPGRSFPIAIEHRGEAAEEFGDPAAPEVVVPAVVECLDRCPDGDVLVFLPGEREIADNAEAIEPEARRRGVEVRTLSSRTPAEAQDRVLRASGPRRVVLSTNVAETSLTVPRVVAVVDSGVARVRRYSSRARVERLLVEPISQSSADQRAGRCGRVAPGLCVRLYSESSFAERPAQTTPEILRSNLAGVVLRMKASGLGEPSMFPFIDPPAPRLWQDAQETLVELGALDRRGSLTPAGRRMAMLPIDPRSARILLSADEGGCLRDMLPIAASLAVPDVSPLRSRPAGEAAVPLVARVAHADSDFLSALRVWDAISEARSTRGSSAFARWCREQGLEPRRVREWIDVHDQLARLVADRWRHRHAGRAAGAATRSEASSGTTRRVALDGEIHRAILAGFVTQIGFRQDDGSYLGVQGPPFAIHRESALARRSPRWIVAAEIIDTGRRTARMVARIQGDWIERVAPHMLRRQHSEPHFLPESGHVAAWEKVTIGGLVLIPRRRVPYEPIDPEGARLVFIHAALVEEQLRTTAAFLAHNRQLRERLEMAEHKRRERGLLVDIEARFAFYDARIPKSVVNGASFESWRRHAEKSDPEVLFMRERDLVREPVDLTAYPDALPTPAGSLPLRYDHAPGEDTDGVTLRVPIAALRSIDPEQVEWLVPGMLESRIEALIRSLPKRLRTRFAPAREFAAGAFEQISGADRRGSLRRTLAEYLARLSGLPIDASDFDASAIPVELQMRFEVVDAEGRVLEAGRDLGALQRRWSQHADASFRALAVAAAGHLEATGRMAWDFPALPESVHIRGSLPAAFPAIVDEGSTVGVRLFATKDEADLAMRRGVRRLALIELASPIEHHLTFHARWPEVESHWSRLRLTGTPVETLSGTVAEMALQPPPWPRTPESFSARLADAATRLHAGCERVVGLVLRMLRATIEVAEVLEGPMPVDWREAIESIREHAHAVGARAGLDASIEELELRTESIEADLHRLRRLPRGGIERDRASAAILATWSHRAAAALAAHPIGAPAHGDAASFARQVERLRIRLFVHDGAIPAAMLKGLESSWTRLS